MYGSVNICRECQEPVKKNLSNHQLKRNSLPTPPKYFTIGLWTKTVREAYQDTNAWKDTWIQLERLDDSAKPGSTQKQTQTHKHTYLSVFIHQGRGVAYMRKCVSLKCCSGLRLKFQIRQLHALFFYYVWYYFVHLWKFVLSSDFFVDFGAHFVLFIWIWLWFSIPCSWVFVDHIS